MHVAIYCPFLVSLLLGVGAPSLARQLPPATATRLLVVSALTAAASSCSAVGVLAFTLVGQLPPVAALGHWPGGRLGSENPVPRAVAVLAVAVVCGLVLSGARVAVLRARAVLAARAFCLSLGGERRQLVVLDEDIDAVAVPAGGGRILASRAHLASLPAAERRALLAHESAHLDRHHHLYRLVADLAGAVDPLQHQVSAAVVYATERWADELAGDAVGRAVVARALARSGLRAAGIRPTAAWAPVALRGGGSGVVPRVRALLAPAPRQRPALVLAVGVLAAFTVGSTVHAQEDTETYFDQSVATSHDGVGTSQR